jgi:hypothetical protein
MGPKMKLGVCGDRCDLCPRYIATKNQNVALFHKIKNIYAKVGIREGNIPIHSLMCFGCSPRNRCSYSSLMSCANEKKINNCGECSGYPCEKMNKVFKETETLRNKFINCCSKEDFAIFDQAFFRKKEYLDDISGAKRYSS